MSATIISGKELAKEKRLAMKSEVDELQGKGVQPGLAVILVGEDPASQSYVRAKKKACEETGIYSRLDELPTSISEQELLHKIAELNQDKAIDGILVQLPLPTHISEKKVIETIDPDKDVDGFHPINIGRMMTGQDTFLPCTPYGIIEMIKSKNISIEGKHAVVIGRSNIVGKPVGQLLLNENATVTYCHSRTENMQEFIQSADIVVAAVGKQRFIHGDDIKAGAVVIDVGVNRNEEGKLIGDVDFDSAVQKASYITPVPGGVGPMTITMLLKNTIQSAEKRT
ncbi:bifunctional methylenetetrahydrofolate dehydrogenase/methenyltetrahydrofolate cyclohydrolase FolD [Salisediminibacterium halotolerans]|uniref:bifunctional methylenetetrahydrofolate dehydrogenase/methenyltetrahydrofolate cyclohydrolase FolD n=1 Tax=Salisediminibacterium halotolerans TaxID=517425 RepID=UPI000EAD0E40|nr:bifunctional methylenetetrahydrofolate dehydrogenase/methenyltetrahydrofolate cyclohydrolase FolD [Salisediminibacterium halotolerans]RLJ78075.1 methenyltetrahydrofolate cyclohydrolase /5,10-methylenetetrahydrofolate dehydrogenase (NADP+) [Actinophytocola xinjiangensis]RPE88587.1 methenyltetrahydrofolate cyclohydrolase /5,10-methylenetetrahydrofolate dehydrogenase (NADP+) [Salisediminibacterium halotolerans]TWG37052.1 methenyltetrahydrofolate cyclohydrolase /5,10-methylenetetrahydrofolate deh